MIPLLLPRQQEAAIFNFLVFIASPVKVSRTFPRERVMEESGGLIAEQVAAAAAARTRAAVKQLHFGEGEETKLAAVAEIKKVVAGDTQEKRRMAALGVIPPMVAMVAELKDEHRRRLVVETLEQLAHGTFKNKALIVEAGLLVKLGGPKVNSSELEKNQCLAPLLSSLSSLAKTEFPIDARQMLPFLIQILDSNETTKQSKLACVAALYNLSTKLENIKAIVSSGAVHELLKLSQNRVIGGGGGAEGALSTLSNLMLSETGKRAIADDPIAVEALMETMAREDEPKCQELAAYLLMVVAHRSNEQRRRMAELGIVQLALEVALLGSPLAQKRALKMLQWFKNEGRERIRGHSGPQPEELLISGDSSTCERQLRECKKAVRRMVKQSLDRNMEVITRRAHAPEGFSRLKTLAATSSSKSLPC
ncbi:hypothetical protein ZIOFF_072337 [Zingiber officinale]|uniref:ARM repeat superfamily protein n=2 Tax=Zingiber officinale TaxID=94328 RepID=A0A8J5CCP9_ZINOF|nr:hypothetical protein ZIOFF_072337 [Zingiber officinale]